MLFSRILLFALFSFCVGLAPIVVSAEERIPEPVQGEDGLYKHNWFLESFLDLKEDLEEAAADTFVEPGGLNGDKTARHQQRGEAATCAMGDRSQHRFALERALQRNSVHWKFPLREAALAEDALPLLFS